jgi:hypothetical protein
MENISIFYVNLEFYAVIWYILWPFGKCCGHLVYFSRFGMFYLQKSGNPGRYYLFVFLEESLQMFP